MDNISFKPSEKESPIVEFKVNINNKDQHFAMVDGILGSLLTGKKTMLTAFISFVGMVVVGKFAYHSVWGQIILIALFIVFIFSFITAIKVIISVKWERKHLMRAVDKMVYPDSILYQFYEEGIYTKNQYLEGFFRYHCFEVMLVTKGGLIFGFTPKTRSVGLEIYNKYNKVTQTYLPFASLSDLEIDHIVKKMRELKKYLSCIKFDKDFK